jgi:hypothetical protein
MLIYSLLHGLQRQKVESKLHISTVRWDGDDFIIKWIKSLVEVAGEISKDNMYDCINYMTENIPNFVPVLGLNSARFDMIFIIDILHNPPLWYIEFIIGNLNILWFMFKVPWCYELRCSSNIRQLCEDVW